MASKYVDISTIKYFMNNVQELDKILTSKRFEDHNIESVDMFIDSVKQFADRELFPYFKEMDENPAHYKDGSINVHQQVERMMKDGGAMGLIAAPFDYDDGGLQLPLLVHTAANYILDAANNHLPGYSGLTTGAAELIIEFASKELKERYAPKMLTGEWGGTMCLTEPQCGTDLGLIKTKAIAKNRHIWWKIRPHLEYKTIEFRVCDAQRSLENVRILSSLCRALIYSSFVDYKKGRLVEDMSVDFLNDSLWKASRFNMDSIIYDEVTDKNFTLYDFIEYMYDYCKDSLDMFGDNVKERLEYILKYGTECDEQLRYYENHHFNELKLFLIKEVEYLTKE